MPDYTPGPEWRAQSVKVPCRPRLPRRQRRRQGGGPERPQRCRVLEQSQPWRAWILSLLIAIMPLSFAVPVKAKALPAAALLVIGLWLLCTDASVRRAARRAAPVLVPTALAFVFWLANTAAHGVSFKEFDVTSHMLAFMGIAFAFAGPLRPAVVRIGFGATTALLGGVCIEQHYVEGIDRAYGLNNGLWGAIEFGMFMLVLSLIAVTHALRGSLRRGERVLHAVCAALGLYGALLTQSRGPLLAFVPVFVLLVMIQGRRTGQWKQAWLVLVGGAAVSLLAAATLHGEVLNRFAAISSEAATYSENDASGAIRERIEMWRAARMAISDHPLAGVGTNQFGNYMRSRIDRGDVNVVVHKYDHPHSEYLEWATTGGIPGLLLLLLLFGSTLVYFLRHALDADDAIALPAAAGLATASMYALCGLTDNVFYRPMPHSLYFFLTLGTAVMVAYRLGLRERVVAR